MDENKLDEAVTVLDKLAADDERVFVLQKPITVGGKEYKELELDFSRLKVKDLRESWTNVPVGEKSQSPMEYMSGTYIHNVLAIAADVNPHVLDELSVSDYTILTMRAKAFLLAGEQD